MSDLSHEQVAIMAAERLGLPETAALDLQPLVPNALNALAVSIAANPNKREWLFTVPASTSVTLTSGVADLTTLISSANLLIDFIQYGYVYQDVTTGQPLIWLNQVGALRMAGQFDNIFSHVARQGNSLFVRGANATLPSGTLYIASSYVPTLAQMPSALDDDLVATVVRLRTSSAKADKE